MKSKENEEIIFFMVNYGTTRLSYITYLIQDFSMELSI